MQTGKGEMTVIVDDVEQPDQAIPLVDDHQEHRVEVRMPVGGNN
jgi:cyclic beta-1,2-glucan synthetase